MAHEGEARAVADGCPLLGGRHLCQQGHRGRASHADGQAQADPVSRRAKNWEDLRGYPLAIEHGYEKWTFIEDLSVANGDFPWLCWFTRGYIVGIDPVLSSSQLFIPI